MATNQHTSPTKYLPNGFDFRSPMLQDLDDIARLLNLRMMNIADSTRVFAEDIRREWQTPRFNPAMDIRLVFDPRGMLIGYIEVWVTSRHPWLWGCVHPGFEGRGVGSALLRWGEARVALELDHIPADLRAAPRFSTLPVQRAHELCEALGWRPIQSSSHLRQEAKKVTGALRLPENVTLQYDVYEKDISQLN